MKAVASLGGHTNATFNPDGQNRLFSEVGTIGDGAVCVCGNEVASLAEHMHCVR